MKCVKLQEATCTILINLFLKFHSPPPKIADFITSIFIVNKEAIFFPFLNISWQYWKKMYSPGLQASQKYTTFVLSSLNLKQVSECLLGKPEIEFHRL